MASLFHFHTSHVSADASGHDPAERFYAAEDGRVAPLSAQECLFVAKSSGEPHVMTLQVLRALDQCRAFRRLDEHIAGIETAIPELAGRREDIRRVLDGLVRRGLLLSDEVYLARLRGGASRAPAPLRAVYVRACDRPDRLGHLLASLAENERRWRARRRVVLIDDSRSAAHAETQRAQLRDFAAATGCPVHYVGAAQTQRLVAALARAHPPAQAAARALLLREAAAPGPAFGGGRSRNIALLLSAGARLALLDDDLRLPLRRADFAADEFDPDPAASACTRFVADMDAALAQGTDLDAEPFDTHLAVCGHTLAACLDGPYPLRREALLGLDLGALHGLQAEARVVSTHHGSYGSSRTESTLWLYHALDAAGREQFWRDRDSYLRNVSAHHIVYGARRARALEVPGFTPFTLDNSQLLPCTNPRGRAEDSLAAALTHYCDPRSLSLELPLTIGHVQESARSRFDHTQAASVPRVNDFLRDLVKQQFEAAKAEDPAQRLALLAQTLRDLAGAGTKARVAHLEEYRRFVHADTVHRLQQQLDDTALAPLYWEADVRAIVQVHAKALLANGAPRLAEWPADLDAAGCAQALSAELNAMAEACEHWPALWAYAAEQGERLLDAV